MSDLSAPSTSLFAEHGAVERQQCWECRRRRLVCDGTQPVCTKCRAARIVCPGYADKKPLVWLAPGQVMSRARKKKGPCKAGNGTASKKRQSKSTSRSGSESNSASTSEDTADNNADEIDVPRIVEIRPEVYDMFEAMLYYNSNIYPDLAQHQFGPSSFVIPMVAFEGVPPPILHTLVSVVLSHRIIQLAEHPASDQLVKPLWTRLYRHRDIAVRAINKQVGDEVMQRDITTIVAVYTLLFAMLQQSFTSSCWPTHISGFMGLMQLHGSFWDMIQAVPGMELSLMALCIVSVLASTTSPRDSQIHVATTEDTLRLAKTYFTETYFPSVTCPPEIFTELILINDLRSHDPSPETTDAAVLILSRLDAFSPEFWSSTKGEHQKDWYLLSRVLHSAAALYAILSLQSSGALSRSSPALGISRARHARQLFALLEEAMATPRVRKRMTWPLVVAGVEAARASREVQKYIGEKLAEMSRDQGCAPPLVAKRVLERFWLRGGGDWEDCFEEPLCLVL